MSIVITDGGRQAAGFRGSCGDCVVRAIAVVTGKPYRQVYDECASLNSGHQTGSSKTARNGVWTKNAAFRRYMEGMGFKWEPLMSIGTGCKVHLKEGELPMGRLIAVVSKHWAAVIDGVVHDSFDSTRGGLRCVYGVWRLS